MKSTLIVTLFALLGLSVSALAEDAVKPAPVPAKQAANATQPAANTPADKTTGPRANDQLTLDATVVTGNRELPKVMYIVPWKKADLSNLPGQPFNTLIDETLAPVDREVFRREVAYYDVVADKGYAVTKSPTDAQATSAADRK